MRRYILKKIEILIIITLCLCFSGCKQYGEKRIVNFITVDSDKISIYYDDFSQDNPVYLVEERINSGISNTLVKLLSEANYDLKLCRYVIVSDNILNNCINELFFALTDNRFAPDVIVLKGETNLSAEKYEKADKLTYPLYNYKTENDMISCVVEQLDNNEKIIIIDNKIYKQLDGQQSFVFDILSKRIKNGIYVFESNNEVLSAELEMIDVYYYVKNDILYINVTAVMKGYKGASSKDNDKKAVEKDVEESISSYIEELLNDAIITEKFNLLWYNKINHFIKTEINTNIF